MFQIYNVYALNVCNPEHVGANFTPHKPKVSHTNINPTIDMHCQLFSVHSQKTPAMADATQLGKLMNRKNVVLFYRDACPYCRDFKPVFNDMIKNWSSISGSGVGLHKVDTAAYGGYMEDFPALGEHVGVCRRFYSSTTVKSQNMGKRVSSDIIAAVRGHYSLNFGNVLLFSIRHHHAFHSIPHVFPPMRNLIPSVLEGGERQFAF